MRQIRSLRARFLEKVEKTEKCWNWTAAKGNHGYGAIGAGRHQKGMLTAHRVAYELFIGPIPDGLCVLHRCDNTACVNPCHLFLGTRTDNLRDMTRKGRRAHKLTYEQVHAIREQYQPQSHMFGCVALGRRYDVWPGHIMRIVHGQSRALIDENGNVEAN